MDDKPLPTSRDSGGGARRGGYHQKRRFDGDNNYNNRGRSDRDWDERRDHHSHSSRQGQGSGRGFGGGGRHGGVGGRFERRENSERADRVDRDRSNRSDRGDTGRSDRVNRDKNDWFNRETSDHGVKDSNDWDDRDRDDLGNRCRSDRTDRDKNDWVNSDRSDRGVKDRNDWADRDAGDRGNRVRNDRIGSERRDWGGKVRGSAIGDHGQPRDSRRHQQQNNQGGGGGGGYGNRSSHSSHHHSTGHTPSLNHQQHRHHSQNSYPSKPYKQGGGGTGIPTQTQEELIEKSKTPIPHEQRRTLILANIPDHIRFFDILNFFQDNWNASVQYALLERSTADAYVRFHFVEDAKRIWEAGSEGLDGSRPNRDAVETSRGHDNISLVSLGVTLKAVHFTNYMVDNRMSSDRHRSNHRAGERTGGEVGGGMGTTFDRKRNWKEDQQNTRGGTGYSSSGGHSRHREHSNAPPSLHHHPQLPEHSQPHPLQPSKIPRYSDERRIAHSQQNYSSSNTCASDINGQHYDSPKQHRAPSTDALPALTAHSTQSTHTATPSAYPTNNTYHRSPAKKGPSQKISHHHNEEEQTEWGEQQQGDYSVFVEAKNNRLSQLATLEQKRDLLVKQEEMVEKQLQLHNKMLTVLKAKKAPASDQSKKMKEILNAQTRVMELKKEMKGLVESIEKLKGEERTRGAFKPKRSLDRRTTVLRVEGFDVGGAVTEDAIREHFATYGKIVSVSMEMGNAAAVALVNFESRMDAERAKSSNPILNELSLSCTWHNLSSLSHPTRSIDPYAPNNGEKAIDSTNPLPDLDANNASVYDGLYDDVGNNANAESNYKEPPRAGNEEYVNYGYDEEEDMVDYD